MSDDRPTVPERVRDARFGDVDPDDAHDATDQLELDLED